MRAIVIPMVGGPEVLTLCEMPDPHPGPRHVAIRVAYAGVNYADIMNRQRGYHSDRFPYVPGLEVAGYIIVSPTSVGTPQGILPRPHVVPSISL